jgi:hypothetical protein
MKHIVNIINQVFEIEKKIQAQPAVNIQRQVERIKSELNEMGYFYHNPLHEKYDETRTDCEANIVGKLKKSMTITDVIKPVIHQSEGTAKKIIQKAIVVVE